MFFTFPKSEISATDLIKGLCTYDRFHYNIDVIIVGGEEHKDGSPHLHCFLLLKEAVRVQLIDIRNHLKIKHFNDAGKVRSVAACLKYITKDEQVTTFPSDLDWRAMVKNAVQRKGIKSDLIVKKIIEAPHDTDIDDFLTDLTTTELGGYAAFRTRQIADIFQIYHGTMKKRLHVRPTLFPNLGSWILGQNHPTVIIWTWLNNVLNNEMNLGDKHLYIYGPTMSGKTSLMECLKGLGWNIYFIPKGTEFFDGYKDLKWDLAIGDEVCGKDQRITWWNQWCDKTMSLNVKGKAAVIKNRVIPTIILSNYSPSELFGTVAKKFPAALEAFERRWEVVGVGPVYGLIDLPK